MDLEDIREELDNLCYDIDLNSLKEFEDMHIVWLNTCPFDAREHKKKAYLLIFPFKKFYLIKCKTCDQKKWVRRSIN